MMICFHMMLTGGCLLRASVCAQPMRQALLLARYVACREAGCMHSLLRHEEGGVRIRMAYLLECPRSRDAQVGGA